MIKRIIFLFFITVVYNHTFSQKYYVSQDLYKDQDLLEKRLSEVSKLILQDYSEKDKETYYTNKRVLQMMTKQYKEALASIDTLRKIEGNASEYYYPDEANLISATYSLYCEAMLGDEPFEKSFKKTFKKLYEPLTEFAKLRFPFNFYYTVKEREDILKELLVSYKNKDSIDQNGVIKLSGSILFKKVLIKSRAIAISLIAKEDGKRYAIQDSVAVTTSDNQIVAVKTGRQKNDNKPKPTILFFDIFPDGTGIRQDYLVKTAAYFGYVGVIASARGKRFSTSDIEPFEHEAKDTYDIIDWISKQPWSNGEVGMMGSGYLGFSQWAATKNRHPALKTIVSQGADGIGIDYPMYNNVFMGAMIRWINYVTNNRYKDIHGNNNLKKWKELYNKWYTSGKPFRALDTLEGNPDKIFQRWLDHPDYDSFWKDMATSEDDFSKIDIPILTTTGYFDNKQHGTMHYMREHLHRNKNAQHYLLIGPYDGSGVGYRSTKEVDGYKIDSIARNDMYILTYQWFDHILKGKEKPSLLKDKINYQVMGANVWKHKPSFKAMNTDTLTYYFNNVRTGKDYKLSTSKNNDKEFIRQEVDFMFRGDTTDLCNSIYSKDFKVRNKLTFTTKPFQKDFDVNGYFTADLKVEINKKDFDLIIELYELLPDGNYFKLSNYTGRVSYSKNKSKRQLLTPNKKEEISINDPFFVSRRVQKGSKLVVLLGVLKNPEWQVNYGTGKDVSDETIKDGKIPLQIKWYDDSTISIPISKVD